MRTLLITTLAIACAQAVLCGENQKPQTGIIHNLPIDAKLFPRTQDYYKDSVAKKIYNAFKRGKISKSWEGANSIPPDKCIEYNPKEQSAIAYVPEDYDGTKAYGVYIHISPGGKGINPKQYVELMKRMNMIYVSPHKTPNGSSMLRRICLAMDSLATIKAHYKVDPKRVVVGGLSGGGHIAMMCHMMYPEQFRGVVSHAAQSYLPTKSGSGHFPGLKLSDARRGKRRTNKWVVISGNKDKNYGEIQRTGVEWKKARMKYQFIDVPGMRHTNAAAKDLERALKWILN